MPVLGNVHPCLRGSHEKYLKEIVIQFLRYYYAIESNPSIYTIELLGSMSTDKA